MKKQIKDETVAEIMQVIIKVHGKHPELRFMQILGNVYGAIDPYYIEDNYLLEELNNFYAYEIKK